MASTILIALLTIGASPFTDAVARVTIGIDRETAAAALPALNEARSRDPARRLWVNVQGLRIVLAGGSADVVNDVSFQVRSGELLGLVGESGSGKTTVALALLGHVRRGLEVAAGRVLVGDTDMVKAPEQQLQRLRGGEVVYIPQDPASAPNPALRVGTS